MLAAWYLRFGGVRILPKTKAVEPSLSVLNAYVEVDFGGALDVQSAVAHNGRIIPQLQQSFRRLPQLLQPKNENG